MWASVCKMPIGNVPIQYPYPYKTTDGTFEIVTDQLTANNIETKTLLVKQTSTFIGDVLMNNVTIDGTATIENSIDVVGDLHVFGNLVVDDISTFNGISAFNQSATFETVTVNDTSDFKEAVTMEKTLTVAEKGSFLNDVEITNDLAVVGQSSFSGEISANGLIYLNGITRASALTVTGALAAQGGVTVTGISQLNGTVNVTGALAAQGGVAVTGLTQMNGAANVTGLLSAEGGIAITGATEITGALNVTGLLAAEGGAVVTGVTQMNGAANVTGAFAAEGGAIITGATQMNGLANVTGAFAAEGGAVITGTTQMNGAANVTGVLAAEGNFDVLGVSTMTGAVAVSGALSILGGGVFAGLFTGQIGPLPGFPLIFNVNSLGIVNDVGLGGNFLINIGTGGYFRINNSIGTAGVEIFGYGNIWCGADTPANHLVSTFGTLDDRTQAALSVRGGASVLGKIWTGDSFNLSATPNEGAKYVRLKAASGQSDSVITLQYPAVNPNSSGQLLSYTNTPASTWISYTSSNTASAIVQRDGSGNVSVNNITASVITSTSTTQSTSITTGSIITPGGVGITKDLYVGGTIFGTVTGTVSNANTLQFATWAAPLAIGTTSTAAGNFTTLNSSSLTASSAVATDASNNLVSVANTGTGSNVLATSPTLVTPNIGAATGTSLSVSGQLTSTVVTGTAPLVVASTTNVANLNASSLNGATFTSPGTIGGTTPGVATFTTLNATTYNAATLNITGLTASSAVATDASKNLVSVANTGTGSNVLATSPTLVTPNIGAATGASLNISGDLNVSTVFGGIISSSGSGNIPFNGISLSWNRVGGLGEGWLLNQSGVGGGDSIRFGSSSLSFVVTEWMRLNRFNLTLFTTDASTSPSTGALIVSGGVGIGGALYTSGTVNHSTLTASSSVATDASKNLVSITNTGTGNNVLATSPALVTPVLGTATATAITASGTLTGGALTTAGIMTAGTAYIISSTSISGQGTYIQWNKNVGDGDTWIINQVGGGSQDRIRLGSGTNANVVTEWVRFTGTTSTVFSNTATSSSSTGALVVTGGVGIGGDLRIGGIIYGTLSGGSPAGNASTLLGSTWAAPGTIGNTTPANGTFTNLFATNLFGTTGTQIASDTIYVGNSTMSNFFIDRQGATAASLIYGYNTAKFAAANALLQVFNNSTDRTLLFAVSSAGTGSGTNAVTVNTALVVNGVCTISNLTASSAVATDASKNLVSVANTGTGSNVLATSPTLVTPNIGAATGTSLSTSGDIGGANINGFNVRAGSNGVIVNNGISLSWNRVGGGLGEGWVINQAAGGGGDSIRFGSSTTSNVVTEWARVNGARFQIFGNTTATSTSTGSLITAGGAGIAGALYTGGLINCAALTVSSAVATDASNNLVSVATTGTGNYVLRTSPTLITPVLGVATGTSLVTSGSITVNSTTATSSSTTGALVVTGGMGIGGYINSAGGVIASGGFSSNAADYMGYARGSFTPQVTVYRPGGSTQGGYNYVYYACYYEKIGRLVTLQIDFAYDLGGQPINNLVCVDNLPYIISAGQSAALGGKLCNFAGVANPLYMQLSYSGYAEATPSFTSTGYQIVVYGGTPMVYQSAQITTQTNQKFNFTISYITT